MLHSPWAGACTRASPTPTRGSGWSPWPQKKLVNRLRALGHVLLHRERERERRQVPQPPHTHRESRRAHKMFVEDAFGWLRMGQLDFIAIRDWDEIQEKRHQGSGTGYRQILRNGHGTTFTNWVYELTTRLSLETCRTQDTVGYRIKRARGCELLHVQDLQQGLHNECPERRGRLLLNSFTVAEFISLRDQANQHGARTRSPQQRPEAQACQALERHFSST